MAGGGIVHDELRFANMVLLAAGQYYRHGAYSSEIVSWASRQALLDAIEATCLMLADPKLEWSGELLNWIVDERAAEIAGVARTKGEE